MRTTRPPIRFSRCLLAIVACGAAVAACTRGDLSTGAELPGALNLAPVYQILPGGLDALPVDLIRLNAYDATTDEVVGTFEGSVEATAEEWALELSIDLDGEPSREVMVEVELLGLGIVEWSGRIGPILVTPSGVPTVQEIGVGRGPLGNLDVTGITIDPIDGLLNLAGSLDLTATTTLLPGSDAVPEIYWASLDETVASIDGSGSSASLFGLGLGSVTVVAVAGQHADSITIDVLDVVGGVKRWVGGAAAGITDWFVHENWSPIGVPSIDDDVVIPAMDDFLPIMTASFQVKSLLVEEGASLDLGNLSHFVNGGDYIAFGEVFDGGISVVEPGDFALQGVADELSTLDDRTLSGSLFANTLRISDGRLTVGPNLLRTNDQLRLVSFPGDAALVMDDDDAVVEVLGDLSFLAADHEGLLTAGELRIGGNLEATGSRFAATGTHRTVFNGQAPQTISLGAAGPTGARFNELLIDGADVDVDTDIYVDGDITVTGSLTIPAGLNVDLGGVITLEAGATLLVDGVLDALGGCVDNGATILGIGISPCLDPFAVLTWVGGLGSDPTDFEDPLNWSPQQEPTDLNELIIPVTGNDPVLSGLPITVPAITIADGATLDLGGGVLTVEGDLLAGATGVVGGVVEVVGPGSVLQGGFETLEVFADRTLSGDVTVSSDVLIDGADLDVGGFALATGDLSMLGTGTLGMTDPGDVVDVAGNALFNGGSHTGRLTDGTLSIAGDLSVQNLTTSFVAAGAHTVVFDGAGLQTVSFSTPGTAEQRFNDVLFDNSGPGVEFLSDVYAEGAVSVGSGTVVDASDDVLGVVGGLDDPSIGLSLQALEVLGDLPTAPASITGDVLVQSTWNLPTSIDVAGSVTLDDNDLILGANALLVAGDFAVTGTNAQLTMDDPGALLDIEGSAIFGGSGQLLQLSDGEIRVAGDFTATGSTSAFGAQVGHQVTLDGTGDQTVTLSAAALGDQHFADLVVANGFGTIFFASDVAVAGTLTIPGSDYVDGTGFSLYVAGGLEDGSDGIQVEAIFVEGDLSVFPTFVGADVFVLDNFFLPGDLFVGGSLFVQADLVVAGNDLEVNNDLTVETVAGRLVMTDPLGLVTVRGNTDFNGASHVGALTAGTLILEGDFIASGGVTSFAATNDHLTRFTALAPQTVFFGDAGQTAQRFNDLSIENSFGVELLTDIAVVGGLTVTPNSFLDGDGLMAVSVADFFDSQGNTQIGELEIAGDLTLFPIVMPYDVRITGDFAPASSGLDVGGDLVIDGGTLEIGSLTWLVNQDFGVVNNGALLMSNGQGTLNVAGSIDFVGGSHDGLLTAGQIQVVGNFSASGSPTSFVSSGTHRVRFVGGAAQEITFDNPGPTTQRFNDVDIRNFSGSVDFGSTVTVMGTFDQSDGDMSRTGPVGSFLDVRGTLLLDEANITGLPVSLVSTVDPLQHALNLVTFQGMDPTEVQMTIRLPGSGQNPGLVADDLSFLTAPTTGAYLDLSSSNGQGWQFLLGGVPNPITLPIELLLDGIVGVVWPWP